MAKRRSRFPGWYGVCLQFYPVFILTGCYTIPSKVCLLHFTISIGSHKFFGIHLTLGVLWDLGLDSECLEAKRSSGLHGTG